MTKLIWLLLAAVFGITHGSGVGHFHSFPVSGVAALSAPPVVAAHSSQYFERTFNRLVAAPVIHEPVLPVHLAPVAPVSTVTHVQPVVPPQVFVEPVTRTVSVPVNPTPTNLPTDHNVAVAIATAHAAAPVTTILLPPYSFAPPPGFGIIPQVLVPELKNQTTPPTTVRTVDREPEQTTPFPPQPQQPQPSNTDNSFAQAPSTNQNTNFQVQQVYGPPLSVQPLPRPQKLKTSVEVVPVPLRYIAPPPISVHNHHHHHHHHHGHRPLKYIHSFVPEKLIVRPVHVHTVKVPAKLVVHRVPVRYTLRSQKHVLRPRIDTVKDVEPTTFRPFRPIIKPPKIL